MLANAERVTQRPGSPTSRLRMDKVISKFRTTGSEGPESAAVHDDE